MALTRIYGNLITSGTITGSLLNNNSITGDKIAPGTITSNLFATGAVDLSNISATTVNVANNLLVTGVYNGGYNDGIVMDYTTGTGRITVGTADGVSLYNGGPNARNLLISIDSGSNVSIQGNVKAKTYQETFSNVSIASGNITCNLANATIFKSVVTSAANVIFTSPPPNLTGFSFLIQLSQTGSYAITWPASVQWPANTAPTLSTTAGYVDTIALYTVDGGSNYYGTSVLGQY